MRSPSLNYWSYQCLLAAVKPQTVSLIVGAEYELRTSGPVAVRVASGLPSVQDLVVIPEAPMNFVADVSSCSIAATTADCWAWFREVKGGCACGS